MSKSSKEYNRQYIQEEEEDERTVIRHGAFVGRWLIQIGGQFRNVLRVKTGIKRGFIG